MTTDEQVLINAAAMLEKAARIIRKAVIDGTELDVSAVQANIDAALARLPGRF